MRGPLGALALMILLLEGCGGGRQNASRYAQSWEFAGNNFHELVQYEFENHILQALGYDMRWR